MLNKKGFTLLEVLLAVAIALVASTMIVQGFVSTLLYSGNTAIYSADSAFNASEINKKVANHTGKNNITNVSDVHIMTFKSEGNSMSHDLSVSSWDSTTGGVGMNTGSRVYENTVVGSLVNRYAVTYTYPADLKCSQCNSNEHLARDANDTNMRWYCTQCDKYIGE